MTNPKERGLIRNAEQVQAILAGATQFRVPVKGEVSSDFDMYSFPAKGGGFWLYPNAMAEILAECPFGKPGDRLFTREAWRPYAWYPNSSTIQLAADRAVVDVEVPDTSEGEAWLDRVLEQCSDECIAAGLSADVDGNFAWDGEYENPIKWRPSIHMPRWASRITLEIEKVEVEKYEGVWQWLITYRRIKLKG